MSIRMLSIDTPEVHYPGNKDPADHDAKLTELAGWLKAGNAPVKPDFAEYLHPKLATGKAGTLQKEQGKDATKEFEKLLEARLVRPNGRKRQIFLRTANQPFDQYGRLLAYMAPMYSQEERDSMSYRDRATFNLHLVESGWAASVPIYPSLPKYIDLVMLQEAAESAYTGNNGAWAEPMTLTGYEFRMCYRLWEMTSKLVKGRKLSSREKNSWITRYCLDMTTREVFEPQDCHKVKYYNRVFVWPKDLNEAVGKMNLVPPGLS